MQTSKYDLDSIWLPRLVQDYTFIMTKPNPNDFTTRVKNFLRDTPRASDVTTSDESFLDRKEFIIMAQKLCYLYTDLIYPPTDNSLIPNTSLTVAQFNVIYRKNIEAFLDPIDLKIYKLVTIGEGSTNYISGAAESNSYYSWYVANLSNFVQTKPSENLVINRIKYYLATTPRADDCRTNDNSYKNRRMWIVQARQAWYDYAALVYDPSGIMTAKNYSVYITKFTEFVDNIDLDIYQSTMIAEAKYRAESDDSFLGIIPRASVINLLTNATYVGAAVLFATVAVEAGAAIAASGAATTTSTAVVTTDITAEAGAATLTTTEAVEGGSTISVLTDQAVKQGTKVAEAVVAGQIAKEVNTIVNPPKTVQRPVPQIVANPQIAVDNTQKKSLSPYVIGGGALMLILGALS